MFLNIVNFYILCYYFYISSVPIHVILWSIIMNPFEFLEDAQAKQHINLSNQAWNIIEQDIMEFENKRPDKISGFINHILENYLKNGLFPADITSTIHAYEEQQKNWLSKINGLSDNHVKEIISSLTEQYTDSLLCELQSVKGIGRKFDVNNTCRYLLKEKGEHGYEASVFKKRGTYINSILEHYSRLPMAKREDIYFADTLSELEYCINKRQIVYVTGSYRSVQLIPYKLMHDSYHMHTYLIAIPYENTATGYHLFRISQIKSLTKTNLYAPALSKETVLSIENAIKEKGVQYLPGEIQKIQVRLTQTGQNMYHRITFQRPAYKTQSDEEKTNDIFTFLCTPYQAYIYFKSFGCEAEILSPSALRNDIIDFHKKAINTYGK